MKKLTSIIVTLSLLLPMSSFAKTQAKNSPYNIRKLALPSEVKNVSKQPGSLYYNPSVKGKALMPIHFWGRVNKAGLHFVPLETKLIDGISMAGGPSSNADLSEVVITTNRNGKRERLELDLEGGGDLSVDNYTLNPGDTIFLKKDSYMENRSYYTSLFGVVATILSSVLLYQQVK